MANAGWSNPLNSPMPSMVAVTVAAWELGHAAGAKSLLQVKSPVHVIISWDLEQRRHQPADQAAGQFRVTRQRAHAFSPAWLGFNCRMRRSAWSSSAMQYCTSS